MYVYILIDTMRLKTKKLWWTWCWRAVWRLDANLEKGNPTTVCTFCIFAYLHILHICIFQMWHLHILQMLRNLHIFKFCTICTFAQFCTICKFANLHNCTICTFCTFAMPDADWINFRLHQENPEQSAIGESISNR